MRCSQCGAESDGAFCPMCGAPIARGYDSNPYAAPSGGYGGGYDGRRNASRGAPVDVDDYFALNIFATLCCCFLIGVFGIVKSTSARSAARAGDVARAEEEASKARAAFWFALGLGLIKNFAFVGLQLLAESGALDQIEDF